MFLFQRINAASGGGGNYVKGAPWRIVWHTTETRNDPRLWVPGWRYPSHLVVDYERQLILQCVPLDQLAKSLWNEPGGVETNATPCIQIEVNGFASETPSWEERKLAWLGREVQAPVVSWIRSEGGDIDLTDIPEPGAIGGSASMYAPQRISFARWNAFNGVCAHRHVPENDHWDAGALNLRRICEHTAEALGAPNPVITAPTQEDLDMFNAYKLPTGDTIYVRNPRTGLVRNLEEIAPEGHDPLVVLAEMVGAGICRPLVTLPWGANWATAVMDGRA